jgi:hypothetical protein
MSDNKIIANSMRFLFLFKFAPVESVFNKISLVRGLQIGLIYMMSMEFFYLLWFNLYFTIIIAAAFAYTFLLSLFRFALFGYLLFCVFTKKNFAWFYWPTIFSHQFMYLQVLNWFLFELFMISNLYAGFIRQQEESVTRSAMSAGAAVGWTIISLIFMVVNLYATFLLFSYTKKLGLGEDQDDSLINRRDTNAPRYNPPNDFVKENLLPNSTIIHVNSNNNVDYSNEEKISLTDQRDVTYALANQSAIVTDTVLPSGLRIPASREGKVWRVIGNDILLL